MLQGDPGRVRDYYDEHPISEAGVLAALAERGLTGSLTAESLFEFDQDHYGGLAAVDALARRAGVSGTSRVLDLCAGLGGPARFVASQRGSAVVALELHPARAAGAARLNRLVKQPRVSVVRADAMKLPFVDGSFDACLSQEALLHIADKRGVLGECHRILVPGGRLAFSDWIAFPSLADRERTRLWEWMAATTLQTLDSYRTLLGRAGFSGIEAEDLSGEWRAIVRKRLELHRALRQEREARFGRQQYVDYDQLHTYFVGLIEAGKLGGGRFSAAR